MSVSTLSRSDSPWIVPATFTLALLNAIAYVLNGATALPCAPGVSGNLVDVPAGIAGAVIVLGFTGVAWLVSRRLPRRAATVLFAVLAVVWLLLGIALVDDVVYNMTGSHSFSTACS
jgi:hypothetical protein